MMVVEKFLSEASGKIVIIRIVIISAMIMLIYLDIVPPDLQRLGKINLHHRPISAKSRWCLMLKSLTLRARFRVKLTIEKGERENLTLPHLARVITQIDQTGSNVTKILSQINPI